MQNFTTMFNRIIAHTTDPTAVDNSTLNTYFFVDIPDIRVGDVLWPFIAVQQFIVNIIDFSQL